jgi:hypothetical protein
LAAYAQLRAYIAADNVQQQEDTISPALEENDIDTIRFVMNDSTVYTSLNDFKNTAARKQYQEWMKLQKTIAQELEQLEALRYQYSQADEAERKQLTPLILQLENNQSQLLNSTKIILQEIRQIEMSAR